MSSLAHFLKTVLVPLFSAALLYLALVHVLLPFVRRHRSRYTAYLPLTSLSAAAPTSWRTSVSDALYNLFMPRSWVRGRGRHVDAHEDELFDDEEGEGMVGFDPVDERRREAVGRPGGDDECRLGRELEEGFRDDSGDEDEGEGEVARGR